MMKVADVTGVAWQQMCVSSWQRFAASPVSGGGGWIYSRCSCLSVPLCLFSSMTLGQTPDAFRTKNGIILRK